MPFDFGIVCAKELELAAAALVFDATPGQDDARELLVCTIAGPSGALRGALVPTSKQRELAAAAATIRLIRDHGVRHVVMTGVAAGVPAPHKPADHVRLGDVVVADAVVKFDEVKQAGGEPEYRGLTPLPDSRMVRAAKMLIGYYMATHAAPWKGVIDAVAARMPKFARPYEGTDDGFRLDMSGRMGRHPEQPDREPGQPLPRMGTVGSSAALLKDAGLRNELASKHGLAAIEMEAAGLAMGAWEEGAGYLFVKGICDYGDRDKRDLWQSYAALASAAFARTVLEATLEGQAVAPSPADRPARIHRLRQRIARMTEASFATLKLVLDAPARGFDCEGGPARCAVALIAWADGLGQLDRLEAEVQQVLGVEMG